jgi:hypothetical protein
VQPKLPKLIIKKSRITSGHDSQSSSPPKSLDSVNELRSPKKIASDKKSTNTFFSTPNRYSSLNQDEIISNKLDSAITNNFVPDTQMDSEATQSQINEGNATPKIPPKFLINIT